MGAPLPGRAVAGAVTVSRAALITGLTRGDGGARPTKPFATSAPKGHQQSGGRDRIRPCLPHAHV
ncbi:hypothetical protein [Streptomyces sp. NPDC060322]|uniref:hypothetical protein n=1 Tax=Streptomyces sp. NPDC060322 TaxID=3347097 RepID=UPI003663B173